jgi:hypothetical protein
MMCPQGSMMMGGGMGGKVSMLLIAMAAGYWVLTLAVNTNNPLKLIGRIVGWLILIVSLAGLICAAVCGLCKGRMCPVGSKPGMAAMSQMEEHEAPAMPSTNEEETEKSTNPIK